MTKPFKIILCVLLGILTINNVIAQRPNPAYRLPVTPDMPEWAKKLYRDDARVNVFELDKEFKEWKEEEEAEGRDEGNDNNKKTESGGYRHGFLRPDKAVN